jgi:hypothetical protein
MQLHATTDNVEDVADRKSTAGRANKQNGDN